MLGARSHVELLDLLPTETVLREHATDGLLDGRDGPGRKEIGVADPVIPPGYPECR